MIVGNLDFIINDWIIEYVEFKSVFIFLKIIKDNMIGKIIMIINKFIVEIN